MPLLNGQHVDSSVINPQEHRFVGMWRSTQPPCRAICPCGRHVCDMEEGESLFTHWQQGHMDEPQYVSLAVEVSSV